MASKDHFVLASEASIHRCSDSPNLRSSCSCSSRNPQTSAAKLPPGQMLGGSRTGITTRELWVWIITIWRRKACLNLRLTSPLRSKSNHEPSRTETNLVLLTSDCTSTQGRISFAQGSRDGFSIMHPAKCSRFVPGYRACIGVVQALLQLLMIASSLLRGPSSAQIVHRELQGHINLAPLPKLSDTHSAIWAAVTSRHAGLCMRL